MDWNTLLWLVLTLVPLLFLERWIHRHLQGAALLIVGDQDVAAWLYALPLLPGVALHELSHALVGWLLGARVGRISILPARSEGRIQLGFVPMEKLSATRTAIVGLAPLFAGCLALLLIGRLGLRLGPAGAALTANDWQALVDGLKEVARAPSVWVWAYLTFAISNTMFPSRSDLRAWPVLLFGLIALVGAVAWMWSSLSAPLAGALRWFSVACGLTALVDLPFALIILLTEKGLERLKGMKIEYR